MLSVCPLCAQWGAATPLMLAVTKDDTTIVKTLLENNAGVNRANQVITIDGRVIAARRFKKQTQRCVDLRYCEGAKSKLYVSVGIFC